MTPRIRLHHYFEASCDSEPTATAVEVEGSDLSYQELDERSNRLAHHLLRSGVDPGSRVAILLPRSVDTYVTLLAVLKAGSSFVPIDPASPQDRVEYITTDADVDLVVTVGALAPLVAGSPCPVRFVDQLQLSPMPATRPSVPVEGDPTAYIIYTSGSSGRPKGVEISQSSICNFISVVPPLYRVRATDRVYQGMTIAFDFSIEEIWPTWAVGAAVVAGPNDARRLGSELGEFLHEHRVTVMYCVPTVLATIDRDLPLIHTLNVGGEACPQELVERWCTGGRVMLNTYGPTEATVTCIMARLEPDRPVTIGHPLPTYEAYLLDEDLQPVPDGEVGEICIGGPGVAVGYVGRPELTAQRFVPNPFAPGRRLYRTGDLGRWTVNGIEYRGRADSEVKVRGHRVDLQEIENVLRLDDAVADAVATVSASTNELAAFVTPRSSGTDGVLVERLQEQLRATLPPYMVPSYLTVVDAFPMLPSGKVDRKSLPDPQGARLVTATGPHTAPTTPLEQQICDVWAEVLHLEPDQVSIDADFFLDLAGHSLAAALVTSALRRRAGIARLAIRDLYTHPTVRSLAQHVEAGSPATASRPAAAASARHGTRRVAVAGLIQLGMLYALLFLFSLPVALVYHANDGTPSEGMVLQLLALFPLTYFVGRWVLPVVGVRLLSTGLGPGTYPLWGAVHLRVWAIQKLLSLSPLTVLSGSPLLSPFLRLLGARAGRRSHIASGEVGVPCLLDLGNDVSVGHGAHLQTTLIEGGRLTLGRVVLRDGAFVGASSMVLPGSEVGIDGALAEHSALGPDQVIPYRERWSGSPSAPTAAADPIFDALSSSSPQANWSPGLVAGFALGVLVLELLPLLSALPVVMLVWTVLLNTGVLAGFLVTALSGPLYVVSVCAVIAGLRALVLPHTPTGILPLHSLLGLRKWFVDKLLETSLLLTNSLYATLYTLPWLRMLGAKIGPGCEVSTVASVSPDLLVLQSQSFVADMAQVGSATHHNGFMALERTEIGRRAFVGNASFIPGGACLADDSLVGVHTIPPTEGVTPGSAWLGSPAIFLPKRQESQAFDETLTYRPTRRRLVERLAIEFLRIVLPSSILASAVYVGLLVISMVADTASVWSVALAAPVAFLGAGLAVVLFVAVLKWLVVGEYVPRVEPLWSGFVRRTELVTGLFEAAAVPALLRALTGTPLLGPLLRIYGTRVGDRTLIDTTYLTEFDLVRIGDDTAVSTGSSLQTHLFEDRVMKMSTLALEPGASLGSRSVVLYDAVVGRDCTVGPLSLVMKGESLAPGTRWAGIPAEFQGQDVEEEVGEVDGAGDGADAQPVAAPGPDGPGRITGIDLARGIALIGMIGTHLVPIVDADGGPSIAWSFFAGRSFSLFVLLAGVGLALSSGGARPPSRGRRAAAAVSLASRAVLLLLLGLALGHVVISSTSNILPYYGVLFLLAIPLLMLSSRALAAAAIVVAFGAPVLMQGVRDHLPDPEHIIINPSFASLDDAVGLLSEFLLTGVYPAIPLLIYICVGLVTGRLIASCQGHPARVSVLASRLVVLGVAVAIAAWLASSVLLAQATGLDRIRQASPGLDEEAITDILVWGPDPTLPTTTWWWLAIRAPHSSTPVDLLHTTGTAMAVLGVMLLVGLAAPRALRPLATAGSMTLTLYTLHIIVAETGFLMGRPTLAFTAQLAAAAGFAVIWQRRYGQGPLERLLGAAARQASSVVDRRGTRAG